MDLDARNLQASASAASELRGVRALLLVGGRPGLERFGEMPLVLLDVLGRSILLRTIDRLRTVGIGEVTVLSDTESVPPRPAAELCHFQVARRESFWDEALHQTRRMARQSECVLVIRLGGWAEVDYRTMISHHRKSGVALTRAVSRDVGALEIFVASSNSTAETAALLRGELRDERIQTSPFEVSGYVNLLQESAELRKLILDSFAGEAAVPPFGRECRPGVWVGRGSRIHRDARVLAPAYIGSFCHVHRGAVVTRGSSLEHHAELDCGTMLDGSTLLPYTRIAAGLEVEQSVVGFHQVHSLVHQITVDVEDTHLIGTTQEYVSMRVYTAAQWVLTFLSNTLWKFLFESSPQQARSASAALGSSGPALSESSLAPVESEAKSYREMVAARRYGDE